MGRIARFASLLFLCLAGPASHALEFPRVPAKTMALPQGRAVWATAKNDMGPADGGLRLTNLTVVLKRTPERQQAFDELLRQQQDPASPQFHHWLTAPELGDRFGRSIQDIETVTSWLQLQGLTVDGVANNKMRIHFSGSAGAVGAAFGAPLHAFDVEGQVRLAISGAPLIPAELAPLVQSINGLETVHHQPQHSSGPPQVSTEAELPGLSSCNATSCKHYIAPSDFAAIYDVAPVYQQGIDGRGQTIAIIGRANINMADIENFQRRANLPVKDPIVIVPSNGVAPGPAQTSGSDTPLDQGEATLDVTRAGSVAPGATIQLVVSAGTATTSGITIATEYVVDAATAPAQVMSISFGGCEKNAGFETVALWDELFSQAAAEGISVFVSSGDAGAAGCDKYNETPPSTQVTSTNDICASSYATCVGGTQFADTANPAAYWRSTNGTALSSAIGYIPEGAWNEPLTSSGATQASATGGGFSTYVVTPSWQIVSGVPGKRGRYTPDVSFSAAGHDAYFICLAASGASCVSDSTGAFHFQGYLGTSAAAPSMAGIAALLNQKMGAAQGNLNPRLYALAADAGNGVFHDITVATSGLASCDVSVPSICNNSTPGTAGLSGGLAGYAVGPGYDLATGLGSIDVSNLLAQWTTVTLAGQLQMPFPIGFFPQVVGTQSATLTGTIANIGGSPVTITGVGGSNLSEFPATTSCFTTLAPGGTCDVSVSFVPSAVGSRSEEFTITSNGQASPQVIFAVGTGIAPNYQGLWWAAPAGSESGWGINFAHQGDTIFASWFTYDRNGAGNWLVMTAPKTGTGTYSGTLYSTTGPPFNAVPFTPSQVTATSVGTATLTFSGPNDGSFAYTIGSTSQVKAITREVFGTLPVCVSATGSLSAATNYTDLWWASPAGSESGWGVNLTHEGTSVFASWFTYDTNGKPMWLVATAASTGTRTYSGTLYRTTGPPFNSVPFTPSSVVATAVGSATFTFTDGNTATFAYTVNGISQSKAITREVFGTTATVCH